MSPEPISHRIAKTAGCRPRLRPAHQKRHAPRAAGGSPRALALLLALIALAGCANTGQLEVTGQARQRVRLTGNFDRAIYAHHGNDRLTFVLLDGPAHDPEQAAIVRMFWMPRGGVTPVDPAATNATVSYLVFAGQNNQPRQLGVYSGAGFLYPRANPGGASLTAELWQANLQLIDRTDAFDDLLGQAILRGRFTAARDQAAVSRLVHQLNAATNTRLDYPSMVQKPQRPHPVHALAPPSQ